MKLDLDRYNRVLWALLGTLAFLGLIALLIGGLVSLWPSGRQGQGLSKALLSPEERAGTKPPAPALSQGLPVPLKGTDLLLVPVENLVDEDDDEPRGFGSYSKGGREPSVVNLLFVNSRTRDAFPLLNKKGLILRHEILDDDSSPRDDSPSGKPTGLVLRIVESDTNGNGRLDQDDEDRIYLCDASGKNLRQVSPSDRDCQAWEYDAKRRVLYLLMRDKVQGAERIPTEAYAVALDGARPAQPLVPKAQMDQLRGMLQR